MYVSIVDRLPVEDRLPRTAPQNLLDHVTRLCAICPRDYRHVEGLNRAADYIRGIWSEMGWTVTEQTYALPNETLARFPYTTKTRYGSCTVAPHTFPAPTGGETYRNLVVDIAGRSPNKRRIVIGAHYDAIEPTPGADDNASGVAGLLELARLLRHDPVAVPITLVAWTNEENPLFELGYSGSLMHARSLHPSAIEGAISLEMIGRFYDEAKTQTYPNGLLRLLLRRHHRGNFISAVGVSKSSAFIRKAVRLFRQDNHFPLHAVALPLAIGGRRFLASDHRFYLQQGIDAFMFTDTAENRGPKEMGSQYHTKNDTPETLNYRRMAQFVDTLHAMLQRWT